MLIDHIDKSAVSLATTVLGPNGLDYKTAMPVAALVIANADTGRIALRGHGHVIPTSEELLPLSSNNSVACQLAASFDSSIVPLREAGFDVEEVSGLTGRFVRTRLAFDVGPTPDGRRLVALPFFVSVRGKDPSARPFGMLWEHRQLALWRIHKERYFWPFVGAMMLSRAFSSQRLP